MTDLIFYIPITALTIATPGPGILLTLSNTLRYGRQKAIAGILGVVAGMASIGFIASISLGMFLPSSPIVLTLLKVVGSAYLGYLGMRLILSQSQNSIGGNEEGNLSSYLSLFSEGLAITLSNPKPIIFFMVLFPQFIDRTQPLPWQLVLLTTIFCLLVFVIHLLYSLGAALVRQKITGKRFFVYFNRITGSIFILFGIGLGISAGV